VCGDVLIYGEEFGDWVMAEDLCGKRRGFAEYFLAGGEIVEIRVRLSSASGGGVAEGGERKLRIK